METYNQKCLKLLGSNRTITVSGFLDANRTTTVSGLLKGSDYRF